MASGVSRRPTALSRRPAGSVQRTDRGCPDGSRAGPEEWKWHPVGARRIVHVGSWRFRHRGAEGDTVVFAQFPRLLSPVTLCSGRLRREARRAARHDLHGCPLANPATGPDRFVIHGSTGIRATPLAFFPNPPAPRANVCDEVDSQITLAFMRTHATRGVEGRPGPDGTRGGC